MAEGRFAGLNKGERKKEMSSGGIRDRCQGKSTGMLAGCVGIGSGWPRLELNSTRIANSKKDFYR